MKYVRTEEYGIVLFPDSVKHRDMAMALGGEDAVTSAGFVRCADVDGLGLECEGSSLGLRKSAAPDDTNFLKAVMR